MQSVASLITDTVVMGSFLAPFFVEIDREIFSKVILLLLLVQEELLSVTRESNVKHLYFEAADFGFFYIWTFWWINILADF